MPGVNLSPDSNNIFSQPQKRRTTRGSNEPARVDAPGRAISKATRRRVDRALREALSEEQLWPTDGAGRASFLVPCLPPVPGGAAARVGDEPPEASAATGAKRARHAE